MITTAGLLGTACTLLLLIIVCLELGIRWGARAKALGEPKGIGTLEAAVFSLFGLLMAFTFSGALDRWSARRALIVQETNAIGTAYLRVDLLPTQDQPLMRQLFRAYVASRIAVYHDVPNEDSTAVRLARADGLQQEIWRHTANGVDGSAVSDGRRLFIPALNEMFDVSTARSAASHTHPPPVIFVLLALLGLVSSLIAGYSMGRTGRRSWLHLIGFAVTVAVSFWVVLEIEFPRQGLIRIDKADVALQQLLDGMK
ncbi:MAG TPA: hypothetical protein VHL57_00995 [Flavobacteriales bacterium]|nr:hypothetical protein [Flavobacteriales bacterium]